MALCGDSMLSFEALDEEASLEVKELCFGLGFKELSAGLPSRGQPDVLLHDLKCFVDSLLDGTSPLRPSDMAWAFLEEFGAGEGLWARSLKKCLRFPRDAARQD